MAQRRGFDVQGLRDFRNELRRLDTSWPTAMREAHKRIADRAAAGARSRAEAMGGVQARASRAIKGYAAQTQASVGVRTGGSTPEAAVAFWGAKKRTGWYAKQRYADSPPQHPPWVGNSWSVAQRGEGPYAVNDELASELDQLLDLYFDEIAELAGAAFPEGAP